MPTVRKYFLEHIPNLLTKLRILNNQSLNEYLYEYLVDTIFGQFFSEEVIFRQLARKIILHLLDRQLLTEAAVEQCVQNVLKSHANDDLPIVSESSDTNTSSSFLPVAAFECHFIDSFTGRPLATP